MGNPILARMASSRNDIASIVQMAKGNPQAVFDQMMKSNPKFVDFVKSCEGKSPEQIATQYGVDLSLIKRFM